MLEPPYEREELERVFGTELLALSELLAPALQHFEECQSLFRAKGFLADEAYRSQAHAARDTVGKHCRSELAGANPERLLLADLVELYPNRMLQFMPGWPTPRVRYLDCVGRAIRHSRSEEDLEALNETLWLAFASEANRYPDTSLPAETREAVVDSIMQQSLVAAGFGIFSVSRASVRKWHPRPSWVDAAVGFVDHDVVNIVLLAETARPRKHKVLTGFPSEPKARGVDFDQIVVSMWAVPKRKVSEFESAAIRLVQRLFYRYSDFYSLKGLRRIIDAHVAAATVMLRKT